MKKYLKYLLVCSTVLLLGCQTFRPEKKKGEPGDVIQALDGLKNYQVQRLELDYGARCRIRIKTQAMDENGACQLIITGDNRFSLSVSAPVGGIVLSVYQDDHIVQILNYHEKTFQQLKNNQINRNRVFEFVNLSVADFREIFWGREIAGDGNNLKFTYEGERPIRIRKEMHISDQLVTIKKWLLYRGIWIPKIINFADPNREIYLKVVITSFDPAMEYELKPPEIPQGFEPGH